jgi:hypothetical protein
LPSIIDSPKLFGRDPPPHGMPMRAEQLGELRDRVPMVDFDAAEVEPPSHSGHLLYELPDFLDSPRRRSPSDLDRFRTRPGFDALPTRRSPDRNRANGSEDRRQADEARSRQVGPDMFYSSHFLVFQEQDPMRQSDGEGDDIPVEIAVAPGRVAPLLESAEATPPDPLIPWQGDAGPFFADALDLNKPNRT